LAQKHSECVGMKLPNRIELKSYEASLPTADPSQFGNRSRFLRSTPSKFRSSIRRDFFSRSDNQRYQRSRAFVPISKSPRPMVFLHLENVRLEVSLRGLKNGRYTPDWVKFIPGPCLSRMEANGPGCTIRGSYDKRTAFVDTQKVTQPTRRL